MHSFGRNTGLRRNFTRQITCFAWHCSRMWCGSVIHVSSLLNSVRLLDSLGHAMVRCVSLFLSFCRTHRNSTSSRLQPQDCSSPATEDGTTSRGKDVDEDQKQQHKTPTEEQGASSHVIHIFIIPTGPIEVCHGERPLANAVRQVSI